MLTALTQAARAGRSYQAFDDSHRPGHTPWFTGLIPVAKGAGSGPATPLTPRPTPLGSAYPTQEDSEREREKARGSDREKEGAKDKEKKQKRKKIARLTADMIKRVDVPVRVNEMSVSGRLGGGRSREGGTPVPDSGPEGTVGADTNAGTDADAAAGPANPGRQQRSPRLGNDDVVRGVTAKLERVAGEQGQERRDRRRLSSPEGENLPDVFTDEEDVQAVDQVPRHGGEAVESPEVASLRVDDGASVAGHPRACAVFVAVFPLVACPDIRSCALQHPDRRVGTANEELSRAPEQRLGGIAPPRTRRRLSSNPHPR